tara:strand:- start:283 stop:747 length:465 start_codon:yes stop_codon:yes gene_type:complete
MSTFLSYFHKLLISGLIIIIFYNIFFILILLFNHRIDGFLLKSWNYSPYKYSELFKKSIGYSKKNLEVKSLTSQKIYYLMTATENKSALDYYYWNNKLLYLTSNRLYSDDFERNFQNAVILSKNNKDIHLALKLFYLRNIPRFSKETQKLIISK